jgi:hypothetical protein
MKPRRQSVRPKQFLNLLSVRRRQLTVQPIEQNITKRDTSINNLRGHLLDALKQSRHDIGIGDYLTRGSLHPSSGSRNIGPLIANRDLAFRNGFLPYHYLLLGLRDPRMRIIQEALKNIDVIASLAGRNQRSELISKRTTRLDRRPPKFIQRALRLPATSLGMLEGLLGHLQIMRGTGF